MVVDEGKVVGEDDDIQRLLRWLMMVFDGIKDEDGRWWCEGSIMVVVCECNGGSRGICWWPWLHGDEAMHVGF